MLGSLRRNEKSSDADHYDEATSDEQSRIRDIESSEDGRVRWTPKTVIATISLCGIWVGMHTIQLLQKN